jgi:hypothetical protein
MTIENVTSNYPNEDRGHRVTRATPSEKLLETSVLRIKQKITEEIEREFESMKERSQHLANITAPMRTLIEQDPRAVASLNALHKLAKGEHLRRVEVLKERVTSGAAETFSFTANPGFQIIAPPYDVEWHLFHDIYQFFNFADMNTGEMMARHFNGQAAAAVGVWLSSPVRSLVRVAPFAPFTYYWSGLVLAPGTTRGSVGVVVYVNDDPQPAFDYRANVWDVSLYYNQSNSGSSTVGRELSRDVLIPMEPGNQYLVWVWCSVLGHTSSAQESWHLVGGGIECEVPFIVINAGPPPHIA